jgi:hypothetical protein|tara:strand:- start:1779 stop:2483 length:705 start_codon:yes stop_codon:yes gene_type:complete
MKKQRNKDIPIEKVLEMQKQGIQSKDIISNLKTEGYKHNEISGAMDQAAVKNELNNIPAPSTEPVGDVPIALMNAPSPSQPTPGKQEMPQPEISKEPQQIIPSQPMETQQTGFAPEPLERASYDVIEEIAESIIKEKWDELIKNVGDIKLWKERTDVDLEGVKQELVRTQEKFENLQTAIMGKIADYSEGINNVGTDIRALEKVLERILSPLSKSVKDLKEVSEKLNRKRITKK